jgi:hypothetical protein
MFSDKINDLFRQFREEIDQTTDVNVLDHLVEAIYSLSDYADDKLMVLDSDDWEEDDEVKTPE